MDVEEYVAEDGSGPNQAAHIPDLVSHTGEKVRLLIVLESPHVDELEARRPVVGSAGRSGLEYLLSANTGESLGNYISARHNAGDWRIAIMNVSNVPLQQKAFARRTSPTLTAAEWEVLRRVRTSKAKAIDGTRSAAANKVSESILIGLQTRINRLNFEAGATVVAAGPCAQRFTRSLQGLPAATLDVHHPSYGNWMKYPKKAEHVELRDLFNLNIVPRASP